MIHKILFADTYFNLKNSTLINIKLFIAQEYESSLHLEIIN